MSKFPTCPILAVLSVCGLVAASAAASQGKADQTADDLKTAVAGNTQFAIDLYGKLREEPGNLCFSPYSISAALAMTYGGARTQTAEEMAKTMHFTMPGERLHAAMGKLQADLVAADKKRPYQLSVANALWGQKNYGFLPDFLDLTRKHYGAGFNEVDFVKETEAARKTINEWVERQTQDKIKELIPQGILDALTRLVLTNAIYFKSEWEYQFKYASIVATSCQISAA